VRLLDEGERGTQIVSTPGGPQKVSVIFEDGIWELIFRSSLPSAKSIKTRVKAILRQLRETGVVDTRSKPMTELEMAERYVAALRRLEIAGPKAEAYDRFMTAEGDYSVGTVAQMLGTGQNRLFARLRDEHIFITGGPRHNTPYQQYLKHFRVVTRSYADNDGAEKASHTTFVRPSGVDFIRKVLQLQDLTK
jgi:anti-repressor protein